MLIDFTIRINTQEETEGLTAPYLMVHVYILSFLFFYFLLICYISSSCCDFPLVYFSHVGIYKGFYRGTIYMCMTISFHSRASSGDFILVWMNSCLFVILIIHYLHSMTNFLCSSQSSFDSLSNVAKGKIVMSSTFFFFGGQ